MAECHVIIKKISTQQKISTATTQTSDRHKIREQPRLRVRENVSFVRISLRREKFTEVYELDCHISKNGGLDHYFIVMKTSTGSKVKKTDIK